MFKPSIKNALALLLYVLLATGLLAGCTAKMAAQEPPTPTPEVFIPRTVVVPDGPMVSGRVLWASTPVAGARVELRIGEMRLGVADHLAVIVNRFREGHRQLGTVGSQLSRFREQADVGHRAVLPEKRMDEGNGVIHGKIAGHLVA